MISADFGDIRLNKRFSTLARELAAKPSLSINEASTDWAASKGAYRFFDNPKVTPELVMEPHLLSTELRCEGHETVIAVQDTSVLDFSKHFRTEGLGLTGVSEGFEHQGLHLHTTLALSEAGLPLGLLDHRMWARERQSVRGHAHAQLPIEQKESYRWIEALKASVQRTPRSHLVVVCDREADIFDLFQEAFDQGCDLVVRLQHDRITIDEAHDYLRVSEVLAVSEPVGTTRVEIPQNGSRLARRAELEVKFMDITLSAHGRGVKTSQTRHRADLIGMYVVDLWERSPPKGEKPLHWRLFTTLTVRTKADALKVVDYYRKRWMVESYFKALKTGCNVEKCRLQEAEKLTCYIALMSVVAWRIMWMTYINRHTPEASCESMLTQNEWKTLWLMRHRRYIKEGKMKPIPPREPPSVYDAVRWIAMQGGFLGRKGDKEPGLITIWRGWLRLQTGVEVFEMMDARN